MSELAAFITARLDEDEAVARAAGVGEWESDGHEVYRSSPLQVLEVVTMGRDAEGGCESPEIAAHIARHDPARVLAECAAKRAIVQRCVDLERVADQPITDPLAANYRAWHDAVRALASVYAGAEGWREEWAL